MIDRPLRGTIFRAFVLAASLAAIVGANERPTRVLISSEPLHAGRISPQLYGGFVELLDDVVPGMWAEMLGDRGFEGILPTAQWCYFRGEPNLCDRDWEKNETWEYDRENPFSGEQSARLTASEVVACMEASMERLRALFGGLLSLEFREPSCGCRRSLDDAMM